MAEYVPQLSNYVTDDEWDALLYLMFSYMGDEPEHTIHDLLSKGVQAMMDKGYMFDNLDADGNPDTEKGQVENINWMKLQIFSAGNPHHLDPLEHVAGGRDYIKEHTPSLLHDTDEEFAEQIQAAYDVMAEAVEKERTMYRRMKEGLVQLPIPEGVLNEDLVGQRVYKNQRLVGIVKEVDEGCVWAKLDKSSFQDAGEGKLEFGLVT